MGFFRVRKSFRLFPGVRVNLGKMGMSTSIGRPGATINIRGDRIRTTVGIPGTGISYTGQSIRHAAKPDARPIEFSPVQAFTDARPEDLPAAEDVREPIESAPRQVSGAVLFLVVSIVLLVLVLAIRAFV